MGVFRLLLTISVIISHVFPIYHYSMLDGDIAVRAFFIISGFYITLILEQKYKQKSYFTYITNRFLRIYPIYWVMLTLTVVCSLILAPHEIRTLFLPSPHTYIWVGKKVSLYKDIPTIIADVTLIVRNDYMILNPSTMRQLTLFQAWTLVIELLFYILAPWIVFRKNITLVGLAGISLMIRYFVFRYQTLHHLEQKDIFFAGDLIFFILGISSYRMYNILKDKKLPVAVHGISVILLFATLGYHYIISFVVYGLNVKEVCYYLLLMMSVPFIFLTISRYTLDKMIGLLSYPMYITHDFVFRMLFHTMKNVQWETFSLNVIIATVIFSSILLVLVELPINRFRQARLL